MNPQYWFLRYVSSPGSSFLGTIAPLSETTPSSAQLSCCHTVPIPSLSQRVAWCCLLRLLTPRHPRRISASGSLHSQPALPVTFVIITTVSSVSLQPIVLMSSVPRRYHHPQSYHLQTTRINWAPAGDGSGLLPHVGLCKTYLSLSLYSSVLSLTVLIYSIYPDNFSYTESHRSSVKSATTPESQDSHYLHCSHSTECISKEIDLSPTVQLKFPTSLP